MYTIARTRAVMWSWIAHGKFVCHFAEKHLNLPAFPGHAMRLPDDAALARFDKIEKLGHVRAWRKLGANGFARLFDV
jgi:hypothetical protein